MSRIFSFISEYFKIHPIKASLFTMPPLVLTIGTLQEKLGILPNNFVYASGAKIVKDPDFGFYTSPK